MRLWQRKYKVDKQILDFCTGNDYILDRNLIKYDVQASIAHAEMLKKIGIISNSELKRLKKWLKVIKKRGVRGKFEIKKAEEDVHTAIENYLTKKCGVAGKKIHTARSRNDQVIAALRLYARDKLIEVKNALLELCTLLTRFAKKYQNTPMPGYTHSRKAMVSSVGLWATAFVEALFDDIHLWKTAYDLNNQSPLGSAAGYGVPLKTDRRYVSRRAGFGKVQDNVLHVQNSRGKFESILLSILSTVMLDLNKMATDIIFFSTEDMGYFILPDKLCTGSSIMPHKKNPDVLELVRAKYHVMLSYEFQVKSLISNLLSGYNRDLQLTKEPFIRGFETTIASLKIMLLVVRSLKVNKRRCVTGITREMFATYRAFELVKKGVPFRDAYRNSLKNIDGFLQRNSKEQLAKKYLSTAGSSKLTTLFSRIKKYRKL